MIDSDDLGDSPVIIINQLYLENYWELDAPLETTSVSPRELLILAPFEAEGLFYKLYFNGWWSLVGVSRRKVFTCSCSIAEESS